MWKVNRMADNSSKSDWSDISPGRRTLLATFAASGLSAFAGCESLQQPTDTTTEGTKPDSDTPMNDSPTNQVPEHDHASSERGGSRLEPEHLSTAKTPVVDVRNYGVVGDGETDDADAL